MTEQPNPRSSAEHPPTIEITRGNASDEELAALIAVVSHAYAQESANAVAEDPVVSAWTRTQRPMRTPLRRDIPWGRFSG
ncbi:acyl-CoA carboxylase subunit epsilon [uncultured Microbacterium sp.]|uniref:acyl-CoA carboxylase subunit epsilon n=1 Tax=uncultured Microbacterium sp. TaxID=191216 RepID=UPI0028D07EA5|nr:acyl-CoA carboxylase subunit epsilon [uncultured Microbacterium sp.]